MLGVDLTAAPGFQTPTVLGLLNELGSGFAKVLRNEEGKMQRRKLARPEEHGRIPPANSSEFMKIYLLRHPQAVEAHTEKSVG